MTVPYVPALLRQNCPRLEVCHTPRRSPPAMHRSQCSDRVCCACAAGSCSVSSSIIGLIVGDRRHAWRRAGRARCTQHCSRSRRVKAATVRNGWPCAHSVEPLPGSCGDHSPTSEACTDVLVGVRCLTKFPMLQCPGAVLSARPVCVVVRLPGQQCGRTSKVERCELTVVLN
jgi:hypothetical protein